MGNRKKYDIKFQPKISMKKARNIQVDASGSDQSLIQIFWPRLQHFLIAASGFSAAGPAVEVSETLTVVTRGKT